MEKMSCILASEHYMYHPKEGYGEMFSSKMIVSFMLVAMAAAVMASGAFAAPAYPGYTGLIFTPTADTLNMGAVNAGASYISGDDDSDISYFSANIGVINGLEAGLGYQNPEVGDSETIINAKYAIMKESFATPGVAVGVSDLSDEIDSTPYVAVSRHSMCRDWLLSLSEALSDSAVVHWMAYLVGFPL